ncbi:hypothetical protein B2J93_6628 [Marssonina coronariae]|uniref:Tafazzin family protein n=1 Tax=Diplocarpon coronariae TaxID=2795749 RepID=A0A218YWP8_9HELO|nr:hypothetical protein JHW43_006553 [Diplocarpon mali]OWO99051.1 hypothetical protein B2J93_6628 [Marssonina coronariae]
MSSAKPSPPSNPSLPWRFSSALIMGLTGSISRGFYYGLNYMEVIGLDNFIETLDRRRDVGGRDRGLITVSNHVSVFLTAFFNYGQVLPTHRGAHSAHGGLFQPVMTQAIRLLSSQPFARSPSSHTVTDEALDPFTTGSLTYSTNGVDSFQAPSIYPSRRHSWIHIFPEGRVHQHPAKSLRYFKWGISRLILESEPLPEIVPIFIDGNQEVMHESRGFPRFLPRVGKKVRIVFGESMDGEEVFGELRERWKKLVAIQKEALARRNLETNWEMGELTDGLKYGTEAVALRKEVTMRIRMEVLKLRRSLGYPDEDPKEGLVETWIEEGEKETGRMKDGSWVGDP